MVHKVLPSRPVDAKRIGVRMDVIVDDNTCEVISPYREPNYHAFTATRLQTSGTSDPDTNSGIDLRRRWLIGLSL